MLGLLGWALFGAAKIGDSVSNSNYTKQSYARSVNNDRPEYYDARGNTYLRKTGEKVFFAILPCGERVYKSVATRAIVHSISNDMAEKEKKEAIKNGKKFYRKYYEHVACYPVEIETEKRYLLKAVLSNAYSGNGKYYLYYFTENSSEELEKGIEISHERYLELGGITATIECNKKIPVKYAEGEEIK